MDHYPYWEKKLSIKMSPGSFGENLSISGLDENLVNIGDVFRIGEAEIQISQPRQPCHKASKLFGLKNMACQVQKTGFTGFYGRVLQPGWMKPGDNLKLVNRDAKRITIEMANHLMYRDKKNVMRINELLCLEPLSKEWRRIFATRIKKFGPKR